MTISPTQHSDFSRTAKIGRGRKPRPIWLSEEFFEFIYFQIGQACNLLALVWSYISLLNGPDKKPKQNSSKTKRHSQQQEAKTVRRRTAVSQRYLFWRVVTGTLRWLASLHCLLYFLAFDQLRPAVLFFLNWTVCLFVKESPIWNYPNQSLIGQFVKIKG